MNIKSLIFNFLLFGTLSCSPAAQPNLINKGFSYISQCEEFLKKNANEDVLASSEFSYVYFFQHGVIVTFTKGEVGSFAERDENYRQIWACGFYQNKLVHVKSPQAEPILNVPIEEDFENYKSNVMELLFRNDGNKFEYCCQQMFDTKKFD